MPKFVFEGSGHTTGSGRAVLLIAGFLLLAGSGGAVAAVAAAVMAALAAVVAVVFLFVAALAVYLVWRARNPSPRGIVPAPVRYELPGPERPAEAGIKTGMKSALESGTTRELHLHFHGVSADEMAEVLRRRDQGR